MQFEYPIRAIVRVSIAAVVLTTGACNTVEGVGKDLGNAGNAISNTAEKTKEKM